MNTYAEGKRRRVMLHYYLPQWANRLLWDKQPQDLVATLRDAAIDFVYLDLKGTEGATLFESTEGVQERTYKGTGMLEEMIEECHKNGIAFGGYYLVGWENLSGRLNPDWLARTAGGESVRDQVWPCDVLCVNTPYRDVVLTQVREIVARFDIDTLWLDLVCFENRATDDDPTCYCKFCQDKFKRRFGAEIPRKDWPNDLWKRFVRWREESVERMLEDIREAARSGGRDIPVISNLTTAFPRVHWTMGVCGERAMQYLDYASIEVYPEIDGHALPSVLPKLARAMGKHKPVEVITTRFAQGPFDGAFRSQAALDWEIATAAANGAYTVFTDIPYPDGNIEPEFYKRVGHIYSEVRKREEWLDGEPLSYAAVVYSHATRVLYGRDDRDTYYSCFSGVGKSLVEENPHLPWTVLVDGDLSKDELSRNAVIVLPNTVCLSDQQVRSLTKYVEGGGGLVATYLTSLWDENGVPREDFGLAKVFGSSFRDSFEKQGGFIKPVRGKPTTLKIGDYPQVHRIPLLKVTAHEGAEVDAEIVASFSEDLNSNHRYYGGMRATLGRPTGYPAVLRTAVGKGRAVFISGLPGYHYEKFGYDFYRKLLINSILWAANQAPPVEVHAPATVEATHFVRKAGSQWVINLVNFDGGKSRPGNIYPLTEPRPVFDIEIIVRLKLKDVRSVSSRNNVTIDAQDREAGLTAGDCTKLMISRIGLWETLVLDLA